jgi:CBS domain-containing protein
MERRMKCATLLAMTRMASAPASWTTRKVADAMHAGVVTVSPDTTLATVADLMANRRLHCVVVADEPVEVGSLWGIVSDLDLVAAACVRSLEDQLAAGSASTAAVLVSPNVRLREAAELMTRHGVSHLVVAEAHRPLGVLSTLDLATAMADAPEPALPTKEFSRLSSRVSASEP